MLSTDSQKTTLPLLRHSDDADVFWGALRQQRNIAQATISSLPGYRASDK
jgi:hypothetical protein